MCTDLSYFSILMHNVRVMLRRFLTANSVQMIQISWPLRVLMEQSKFGTYRLLRQQAISLLLDFDVCKINSSFIRKTLVQQNNQSQYCNIDLLKNQNSITCIIAILKFICTWLAVLRFSVEPETYLAEDRLLIRYLIILIIDLDLLCVMVRKSKRNLCLSS